MTAQRLIEFFIDSFFIIFQAFDKKQSNFAPKPSNTNKGQIQLSDEVKRQIINFYLEESQRTPNKSAALTTYKVKDKALVRFYDEYCMRKTIKNKKK